MEKDILLKKIGHDEFKTFAREQIAKEGFYKRVYSTFLFLSGFLFFACTGYGISLFILDEKITFPIQLATGILFCFTLLIVLHELLHGIAYKLMGAKKIYFGAILSQFIFYAGSDQERFDGRKFRFIALFPFVCILMLGLICLLLFPEYFLIILTVLFIHTIFCGGDFAVLNFMEQYKLSEIYTFDSREKRETYFYQNS